MRVRNALHTEQTQQQDNKETSTGRATVTRRDISVVLFRICFFFSLLYLSSAIYLARSPGAHSSMVAIARRAYAR
jgi:hypothetical protein